MRRNGSVNTLTLVAASVLAARQRAVTGTLGDAS